MQRLHDGDEILSRKASRVVRRAIELPVCRILTVRRPSPGRGAGGCLMEEHDCSDTAVLQPPVDEEHLTGGEVYTGFIDHLELNRELEEPSDSIIASLNRAGVSRWTQEASVADAAPTNREVFGNGVVASERL